MARKAMIEKQKRRVACAEKYRQRRMDLLEKAKDMSISEQERELARIGLQKLPKNSSRIRLRNRCQLTGRSRGFLRRFKVSRICLRELAGMGLVPGLLKASW